VAAAGLVPVAMAAAVGRAICTEQTKTRPKGRVLFLLEGPQAMALFSQQALNPGVRKREVFGWAMYDFANSGYTTVVITAVFAAYFVGGIAGGAAWATFAWTAALSASYAIVMVTMPAIGAWADLHAAKKRVLLASTACCVAGTAALALTPSLGGAAGVALAMLLVIVSNTFYSYGESLTGAFLPELATAGASATSAACWRWACAWATCCGPAAEDCRRRTSFR
jgi:UMF1 family MFS transporter